MYRPIFLHVLAILGIALAIGNWAIDVAGSVDAHGLRPAITVSRPDTKPSRDRFPKLEFSERHDVRYRLQP
jgi:hypothetical protein